MTAIYPPSKTPRDYQTDVFERAREEVRRGRRRVIIQAQTGAGKTLIAAWLIRLALAKGKKALFLAHQRELVNQASRELWDVGVPHGVIMAQESMTPAMVQVASKDTLLSWGCRRMSISMPEADLLIADECHRTLGAQYQKLLSYYPKAAWVGLSATPTRTDGRGLGDRWDSLVQAIQPSVLLERGFLVPTKCFSPYRPDLKGVTKDVAGNYNKKLLLPRMDKPRLVGDIVAHWKRLAQGRSTVVFASGVRHSLNIRNEFRKAGIPCEHVDGSTDLEERKSIFDRLASGELLVVSNVGVCVEGIDIPRLSCAVLALPTGSFIKYRQMAGRIQRPFEGKTDALILDHAGNVYRHGFPDADIDWALEKTEKIQDEVKKRLKDGRMSQPITCPQCACTYPPRESCPNCGYKSQKQARKVASTAGKLVYVGGASTPSLFEGMDAEKRLRAKQKLWDWCLGMCANSNKTCAAAATIYRKKTGEWPSSVLRNVPRKTECRRLVKDVFPQYVNPRKGA